MVLNLLWRAHLRRQDRKLMRAVCAELGLEYAEPVASGVLDGVPIEISVLEKRRPARITTGLPKQLRFVRREDDPTAPGLGEAWLDGTVALRGDPVFWLRALDRKTARALQDLVVYSNATLSDGILAFQESLRARITNPTVAERVDPIRAAVAVIRRLLEVANSQDESGLLAAFDQGGQRQRLTAIRLAREKRSGDPGIQAKIDAIASTPGAETQILAALVDERWGRLGELALDERIGARRWMETIETLRAVYPQLEGRARLPLLAYDEAFRDRTTPIAPDKYASTVGLGMSIAIAHTAFYDQIDRDPRAKAIVVDTVRALCGALATTGQDPAPSARQTPAR